MLLTGFVDGLGFMLGAGFMAFVYWLIILKVLKNLIGESKAFVWRKFLKKITGGLIK
jgi:hypothetical protein